MLALEAGLSRQRLYEHHADLITEFKQATGSGPVTPSVLALQEQLATSTQRNTDLEAENVALRARISALAAVVTELTHDLTHPDPENVSSMPIGHLNPRRQEPRRPRRSP